MYLPPPIFWSIADRETAEEIKDASLVLPRSIMASLFINGALGFVMLVTYCFCLGNVEDILTTKTGYPFIQVFYNVTKSAGGASAMTSILITMTVCGCISNVATASRQLFAFARDGGMPFSPFLAHVRLLTEISTQNVDVITRSNPAGIFL